MCIRRILVPVLPDIAADTQFEAALKLAHHAKGHISGLCLRPDSELATAPLPMFATTANALSDIERDEDALQQRARAAFTAWRNQYDLASEPVNGGLRSTFAFWSEQTGPLETAILQQGRLSDLIVLAYPGDFCSPGSRLFDIAVFETGRPVLLVPKRLPNDLLRHVIVAWNGSLEATRAVAAALPLLRGAGSVSVFTAPWRNDEFVGEDDVVHELSLPEYLAWQGIHARSIRAEPQDSSVTPALLRLAVEQDATLIVMGAFTRSRIRQVLLGGVTRGMVHSATRPVLMTH